MTTPRTLRNETTVVGQQVWKAVDTAVSRAPEWMKVRLEKAQELRSARMQAAEK